MRDHRACMRAMEELIEQHGLADDLDDLLIERTGNTNFWLGEHDFMDEGSDAEDVEAVLVAENAALRASAADASTLLLAAQQVLNCGRLQRDVEQARMALEDLRSNVLRD